MEEIKELARDEAANQWVDDNVSESDAERLRSWARQMVDKHDEDDQAQLGVLLTQPCKPFDTKLGELPYRAHVYALIFSWDDGREPLAIRSALKINDANQVIDFIIIDKE